MDSYGFLVVIKNNDSDEFTYAIPNTPDITTKMYTSYLEAKKGIMEIIDSVDHFIPVAYGSAYPYENTTFEKEISKGEFALLGWIVVKDEDNDENDIHISIGLLKLPIQGNQPAS
jgi:hypothetical protein